MYQVSSASSARPAHLSVFFLYLTSYNRHIPFIPGSWWRFLEALVVIKFLSPAEELQHQSSLLWIQLQQEFAVAEFVLSWRERSSRTLRTDSACGLLSPRECGFELIKYSTFTEAAFIQHGRGCEIWMWRGSSGSGRSRQRKKDIFPYLWWQSWLNVLCVIFNRNVLIVFPDVDWFSGCNIQGGLRNLCDWILRNICQNLKVLVISHT